MEGETISAGAAMQCRQEPLAFGDDLRRSPSFYRFDLDASPVMPEPARANARETIVNRQKTDGWLHRQLKN
jgi:hypothetical protein